MHRQHHCKEQHTRNSDVTKECQNVLRCLQIFCDSAKATDAVNGIRHFQNVHAQQRNCPWLRTEVRLDSTTTPICAGLCRWPWLHHTTLPCSWWHHNENLELTTMAITHTHTHTCNGPFPGLPGWAGTRKVKPIWILLKQETVSGSGISWAVCKSAPRSRQITTPAPHHSVFLQAGCPSCCPTNSIKALKAQDKFICIAPIHSVESLSASVAE